MHKLARKLAVYCCNVENFSIYIDETAYGIELMLEYVSKFVVLCIIGSFWGYAKESCLFMVIFGSIRSQIGGKHMNTSIGCMICMFLMIWSDIFVYKQKITCNTGCYFIVGIVLIVIIYTLLCNRKVNLCYLTKCNIQKQKIRACMLMIFWLLVGKLYCMEVFVLLVLANNLIMLAWACFEKGGLLYEGKS